MPTSKALTNSHTNQPTPTLTNQLPQSPSTHLVLADAHAQIGVHPVEAGSDDDDDVVLVERVHGVHQHVVALLVALKVVRHQGNHQLRPSTDIAIITMYQYNNTNNNNNSSI